MRNFIYSLVAILTMAFFVSGTLASDAFAQRAPVLKRIKSNIPEMVEERLQVAIDNCFGPSVRLRDLGYYRTDINRDRVDDYIVDWVKVRGRRVLESCNDTPCDEQGCYLHVFVSEGRNNWFVGFSGRASKYNVILPTGYEGANQDQNLLNLIVHSDRCNPSERNASGQCEKSYTLDGRSFTEVRKPIDPQLQR